MISTHFVGAHKRERPFFKTPGGGETPPLKLFPHRGVEKNLWVSGKLDPFCRLPLFCGPLTIANLLKPPSCGNPFLEKWPPPLIAPKGGGFKNVAFQKGSHNQFREWEPPVQIKIPGPKGKFSQKLEPKGPRSLIQNKAPPKSITPNSH